MSVKAFLNDPPPKEQKQAPPVVRHVIKKISVAPVVKKVDNLPPPRPKPPVVVTKITPKTDAPANPDDVLAFSIYCKIFLPKSVVKYIDDQFVKLACGKIFPPTLKNNMQKTLEPYTDALDMWNCISNNKMSYMRRSPVCNRIRDVVNWFHERLLPTSSLFAFFNFIIQVKMNGQSWVHVLATLISEEYENANPHNVAQLMRLTQDLMQMINIKKEQHCNKQMAPLEYDKFIGIDEPKNPYDRSKEMIEGIPSSKPPTAKHPHNNKKQTIEYRRITPAYIIQKSELPKGSFAFLFNAYAQSYPVIYENPPKMPQETIKKRRTIFDILEGIEVNEHTSDQIYAFSEYNPYSYYCYQQAGRETYQEKWGEIEPFIGNKEVRSIVIERCRSLLPQIESEHIDKLKEAETFFALLPTNQFTLSIRPCELPESFDFPSLDDPICSYIRNFLSGPHVLNRFGSIRLFLDDIFPLFISSPVRALHLRAAAHSLWYFSLLCRELRPIIDRDAVEMLSYDSVVEVAQEEIAARYRPNEVTRNAALTSALKKLLNDHKSTDNTAEFGRLFGARADCVAHFMPLLKRLNGACELLQMDPRYNDLEALVFMFATPSTASLLAKKRFYDAAVAQMNHYGIVEITHEDSRGPVKVLEWKM